MQEYKLRYLPMFYDDFEEIINYISTDLMNPQAATDLIDAVEEAILKRMPFAESFGSYHSMRERQYPYYRIHVKNYVVFYVVIDDGGPQKIMEVRRILYDKQNWEEII